MEITSHFGKNPSRGGSPPSDRRSRPTGFKRLVFSWLDVNLVVVALVFQKISIMGVVKIV